MQCAMSAILAAGLNEPADEENDKPELDMSIKVGCKQVIKILVGSLQLAFAGCSCYTDEPWYTVH